MWVDFSISSTEVTFPTFVYFFRLMGIPTIKVHGNLVLLRWKVLHDRFLVCLPSMHLPIMIWLHWSWTNSHRLIFPHAATRLFRLCLKPNFSVRQTEGHRKQTSGKTRIQILLDTKALSRWNRQPVTFSLLDFRTISLIGMLRRQVKEKHHLRFHSPPEIWKTPSPRQLNRCRTVRSWMILVRKSQSSRLCLCQTHRILWLVEILHYLGSRRHLLLIAYQQSRFQSDQTRLTVREHRYRSPNERKRGRLWCNLFQISESRAWPQLSFWMTIRLLRLHPPVPDPDPDLDLRVLYREWQARCCLNYQPRPNCYGHGMTRATRHQDHPALLDLVHQIRSHFVRLMLHRQFSPVTRIFPETVRILICNGGQNYVWTAFYRHWVTSECIFLFDDLNLK